MNLHEYQAKQILKSYGVPVPVGVVAETAEKAVLAAEEVQLLTGSDRWAVKAQIHAGGRGKGGGVKIVTSLEEVKEKAQAAAKWVEMASRAEQGKSWEYKLVPEDAVGPGREFGFVISHAVRIA